MSGELEKFQKATKSLWKKEPVREGVIEKMNGNHFVVYDNVEYRIDGKGLWKRKIEAPLSLPQQFGNTMAHGVPGPIIFLLVFGFVTGLHILSIAGLSSFLFLIVYNFKTEKPRHPLTDHPSSFNPIAFFEDSDLRNLAIQPELSKTVIHALSDDETDFEHTQLSKRFNLKHNAKLLNQLFKLGESVGGPTRIDVISSIKSFIENPASGWEQSEKLVKELKEMERNLSKIISLRNEQVGGVAADVIHEANSRIAEEVRIELLIRGNDETHP